MLVVLWVCGLWIWIWLLDWLYCQFLVAVGLDGWRLVGDLSVYGCWWGLVCYSLYLFLCLLVSGFVLLVHRFGLGV